MEDGTGNSSNIIETFDAYALHETDAYSWRLRGGSYMILMTM